ncbi:unnamed protein product [Linum tenue]|uniref:Uncharacterized protein n=1 Tax=Linum tenue TaxID=586396 RepID=A0AAV0HMT3_9ROSI|nr:unnamed protein product [Linum tenue]
MILGLIALMGRNKVRKRRAQLSTYPGEEDKQGEDFDGCKHYSERCKQPPRFSTPFLEKLLSLLQGNFREVVHKWPLPVQAAKPAEQQCSQPGRQQLEYQFQYQHSLWHPSSDNQVCHLLEKKKEKNQTVQLFDAAE